MSLKIKKRQWVELLTLSSLHTTVDMFAGMFAYLISAIIGIVRYKKSVQFKSKADGRETPPTRPSACFTDTMIVEEQELK